MPKLKWLALGVLLLGDVARADDAAPTQDDAAPEKIVLRLRLQKGQVFDQVMAVAQKTASVVESGRAAYKVEMRLWMRHEVLEVSPQGNARLRLSFMRVTYSMTRDDLPHKLVYDSSRAKNPSPPGSAAVQALLGQSVILTISPLGKTLQVEGMDNILERLIKAQKLSPAQQKETKKELEQYVKNQTESQFGIISFPTHTVGVGDRWQVNITPYASLPLKSTLFYRILSRRDGIMRVATMQKITSNSQAVKSPIEPLKVKLTMNGALRGVLSLDEKTGWTTQSEASGRILVFTEFSFKHGGKAQSDVARTYNKTTARSWTIAPPKN